MYTAGHTFTNMTASKVLYAKWEAANVVFTFDKNATASEVTSHKTPDPYQMTVKYGSSIAAHIRQHRMEKASALLLESGDSLAQVARAVGYESQSKFSAEFKKVFGILPSEFRKLHAGH